MVLASWNVHGWVGADGIRDPVRSFEVIRDLDADVIALQEVEGSDWESLARVSGYRPLVGSTRPRAFGNALLVRVDLVHIRHFDLSVPGREPRGALDAIVSGPAGRLRVVATHLGLRVSERRRQAAQLARHLDEHDARVPVVLIGDLNDWTPWGSQLRPLARIIGPLSRIPTFPSNRPVFPLDRAAWRTPRLAPRLKAIRSRRVRSASDHLPLRLELDPSAGSR